MRALLLIAATALALPTQAQWTIQNSGTIADLRGIANAGNGIAWASGTEGTVLRTTDTGKTWQRCPTPPNADLLDFRGIQAFDANTAIVMSSGKGDLSRLYKTTDGCQTWKLLFTNPDKDGFWDAIKYVAGDEFVILGDSIRGKRDLWEWGGEDGDKWHEMNLSASPADKEESSFAASNSILELPVFPMSDASPKFEVRWASGTSQHAYINLVSLSCHCRQQPPLKRVDVPLHTGSQSSGIFSFNFRNSAVGIAVGGDFERPLATDKIAAYSTDGGLIWQSASTQPHGYRSAVAYNPTTKTWITIGPNGTDISTDDGRNWRPLKPSPTDTPDADRNWNALSLPFVVGPHGRIGILNPTALK
jgi:hypothetical protein